MGVDEDTVDSFFGGSFEMADEWEDELMVEEGEEDTRKSLQNDAHVVGVYLRNSDNVAVIHCEDRPIFHLFSTDSFGES